MQHPGSLPTVIDRAPVSLPTGSDRREACQDMT